MSGTISKLTLVQMNCVFTTLDNGTEIAFRVSEGALGDIDASVYMRWSWDTDFTAQPPYIIASSEFDMIQQFLRSAGIWSTPNSDGSPSWEALANGNDQGPLYQSPEDNQFRYGIQAVNQKFRDWVRVRSTADCEAAAYNQFFQQYMLGKILTPFVNDTLAMITQIPSPPPPPPTPAQQFPPNQIGVIGSCIGLCYVLCRLITISKDPADGNKVVLGAAPIPTS